jgi:S-formylglutathione hydrolase FrmB
MMRVTRPGLALLALLWSVAGASAWFPNRPPRLAGTLIAYTRQHGVDRRIWAPTLGQWRDLNVYLPPGYDPTCRYPVMLWLHGIAQDEHSFMTDGLRDFDAAIAAGTLPPLIIAMPDGSLKGEPRLAGPRPLYLNSNLGNFEDYIVEDVWSFMRTHYPLRPEREAHVIAGFSAGGAAAYRFAFKRPDQFGIIMGVSPPLNIRWVDCHGHYLGKFDPNCWGWREDVRQREVIARFYLGLVKVRLGTLVQPLFGKGPHVVGELSQQNPIEMLDRFDVQPGEYQMFIAYGGRDQFNMDAQIESFLYRARQRGLPVEVAYDPHGRHNLTLAEHFMPRMLAWLGPLLEPYRCFPLGCAQEALPLAPARGAAGNSP